MPLPFALLVVAVVPAVAPTAAPPASADATRVLIMDLQPGKGVERDTAQTFTELTTAYLGEESAGRGLLVVSRRDIARLADLEADKQAQGCDNSDACMAEIAGALGARFVVFGRLSKLGDGTFLHATLLDAATGQPLTRKVVNAEDLGELAEELRHACRDMARDIASVQAGKPVARPPPGALSLSSAPAKPAAPAVSSVPPVPQAPPRRVIGAVPDDTSARAPAKPAAANVSPAKVLAEQKAEAERLRSVSGQKAVGGAAAIGAGGLLGVLGGGLTAFTLFSVNPQTAVLFGGGVCCVGVATGATIGILQLRESVELTQEASELDPAPTTAQPVIARPIRAVRY